MPGKDKSSGPNMSSAIIAGVLTFFLGAVLGCLSLVTMPVKEVVKLPDEDEIEPGDVYFIRGSRGSRTAWLGKEQAWRDGRFNRLIVNEEELNQWSEERLKEPAPAPDSEEEADAGWFAMYDVAVEPVNFRIFGDRVQLATHLSMPGLMPDAEILYMVTGTLSVESGRLIFLPEEGTLGKAPVGAVPVLHDLLFSHILKRFTEREDLGWLAESMGNMEAVAVSDGRMILNRPGRG